MVLATSISASTRVLPVLANAAMAGADMPPLLPVLPQAWNQQQQRALSAVASCIRAVLLLQLAARLLGSGCR